MNVISNKIKATFIVRECSKGMQRRTIFQLRFIVMTRRLICFERRCRKQTILLPSIKCDCTGSNQTKIPRLSTGNLDSKCSVDSQACCRSTVASANQAEPFCRRDSPALQVSSISARLGGSASVIAESYAY